MVVNIVKVDTFFVKESYLFIIHSRRECNLSENVVEFELIHLNFNVHLAIINLWSMALLTSLFMARIHLGVESMNAP